MEPDRPAGSLPQRLALRARLFGTVRDFFAARNVTEVDTPALASGGNPDPAIEPVVASVAGRSLLLHTSPELPMKRLLAAGSGDIWQLCRVFRDGESGRWHEPDFLMLEWYRTGFDEHALMREVGDLLAACFAAAGRTLDRTTLTYADAFRSLAGFDPIAYPDDALRSALDSLARSGTDVPPALDADAALDLVMSTAVIPALPRGRIVFIHDYPASQAALAAINPGREPVAARFEVFVDGVELGNGYRELTDATEQRRRFERDRLLRLDRGLPPVAPDETFLAALEAGMPACAGVALGFDRIAAAVAGDDALRSVMDLR